MATKIFDGEKYVTEIIDGSEEAAQEAERKEKTRPFTDTEVLRVLVVPSMNTLSLDNNTALRCINYHPEWNELCASKFVAENKGFRFRYKDKLYATVQDSFTFQSQWVPGTEGTSSIYSQVNWVHDGTKEDPIPVPDNVNSVAFTYIIGKYYDEGGTLYLCMFDGEDDGTEHSFVYKPSEVPTHFKKVE